MPAATQDQINRIIAMADKLDPDDPSSMKQYNLTLQAIDRAVKLSETKLKFELMRYKAVTISDEPKKLRT